MWEVEKKVDELLRKKWPDAELSIEFADGKHMTVSIASQEFAGKKIIEQHKMVYEVLNALIESGELHAIKLITKVK